MDRTSNSVEYGILINQQNYDGYAIIAEIRQKVESIAGLPGRISEQTASGVRITW